MLTFTVNEIIRIREARDAGGSINNIVRAFAAVHTRDEVIEAYWAIVRQHDRSPERAARDVNNVLALQEQCVPLINGKPAVEVIGVRGTRSSLGGMF